MCSLIKILPRPSTSSLRTVSPGLGLYCATAKGSSSNDMMIEIRSRIEFYMFDVQHCLTVPSAFSIRHLAAVAVHLHAPAENDDAVNNRPGIADQARREHKLDNAHRRIAHIH